MDDTRSKAQTRRNPMPVPNHDRHFYSRNRAFGRFGIRIFEPELMPLPHWHGHVELNFAMNFRMAYDFDGTRLEVPDRTAGAVLGRGAAPADRDRPGGRGADAAGQHLPALGQLSADAPHHAACRRR